MKKTVISNGGREITGNIHKVNLSLGQSLAGSTRGISTPASIGFWYVLKDPGPRTKIAKNPVAVMIEENGFGAIGIGNTAGNPIASMRAVGGLPLVSVLNENGIDLAGMHDLWFKRFYEY